jgi:hypothetical protein
MHHLVTEAAQWGLLLLPHIKDLFKGEGVPGAVKAGIDRIDENIKDMVAHRVEFFLFLHREMKDKAGVRDFERWWRLIELRGERTYPNEHGEYVRYEREFELMTTSVISNLQKHGSGMEYEFDKEGRPQPEHIRKYAELERQGLKNLAETLICRSDEERDGFVLIMYNNLPEKYWGRITSLFRPIGEGISYTAEEFAGSLEPINGTLETSLNEFRSYLGLKPISGGTHHGQPFSERLKKAWRG